MKKIIRAGCILRSENKEKREVFSRFLKERRKELLIIFALALVLGFAVWRVFYDDTEKVSVGQTATQTETERKLSALLTEIDGVGDAEVMICETEDGVKSVVVVCSGAENLQVVMDIREAVAAALGTDEKSVKIYLKKD